jgi:hypothetical protein
MSKIMSTTAAIVVWYAGMLLMLLRPALVDRSVSHARLRLWYWQPISSRVHCQQSSILDQRLQGLSLILTREPIPQDTSIVSRVCTVLIGNVVQEAPHLLETLLELRLWCNIPWSCCCKARFSSIVRGLTVYCKLETRTHKIAPKIM